ncbi:MAG: hypothetical protein ACJ795_05345, partial [Ktedonobacteraceae bacterium]
LKYIIRTSVAKKAVYVGYRFQDWYYLIKWKNSPVAVTPDTYSVLVDHVDQAFTKALLDHMQNTKDFAAYQSFVQHTQQEKQHNEEKIKADIARIERRMQATIVSLTTDPDLPTVTRTALNAIYAELAESKQTLLQQLAAGDTQQDVQIHTLLSYHDLLARLSQRRELVFDDMQLLAQATTKQVTLDGLSPHFLLLTIDWRTPVWGKDTALLWRPRGRAPFWTEAERDLVKQHYPCMPQKELMRCLPQRSWQSVITIAHELGIARTVRSERLTNDTTLSYEDIQVMKEYHLSVEELSCDNQIIWQGSTEFPNGF